MYTSKLSMLGMALVLFLFSCNSGDMTNQKDNTGNTVQTGKFDKKVDSVLSLLSLEEKIGQLNQYTGRWDMTGPAPTEEAGQQQLEYLKKGWIGSMLNVLSAKATREAQKLAVENSKHGIPLIFGYDVIHGYKTMFPVPLGEAASWDLEAIEKSSQVAAREAAAAGLHWTFAPMVDISRDARWGRVMEGAGEDVYLGSLIAAARVKGFQGGDLSQVGTLAACAKHYAGYGFAESGRDYNTVDVSMNTLYNTILPPFKACVDVNVATFMNSFNDLNGIPATGSNFLLRDILKGDWNYQGFVVSDWGSIGEMIAHGYAADKADAALKAIEAGCDMDMEANCYIDELANLVKAGKVDEALIDDAVRRILKIKFELGLFDDPYKYCNEELEKTEIYSKENIEIARDVARKSIVLLKNENNILPLKKDVKTIAVIGPLGNDKDNPLGSWRAQAETNSAVSVLEGIKEAVSEQTDVKFAEGCKLRTEEHSFAVEVKINTTDRSGFAEAIQLAKKVDVVVMAIGEDAFQSGEGRSRSNIDIPGLQGELLKEVHKVNPNIVLVLMNGRPLTINWEAENIPAIVEAWHLGTESGHAIADVLFGDYNPSGKLPVSFPRSVGQLPLYYNYRNTGRPTNNHGSVVFHSHYIDVANTPLYPFGYGLSYSTFEYSDIKLSANEMLMDGELQASVEVKNASDVEGKETVQLYIRDLVGSVVRPVKELKGFQQIVLKAGETKTITFTLTKSDLSFFNQENVLTAEAGKFKVFVGTNSSDVKEAEFELK